MAVRTKLIILTMRRSARRFETATRDPAEAQQRKLLWLMDKNKDTEYGRRHGFASVRTFTDFQRQIPVASYEDIQEDMQRVFEGAENVFTAEKPIMFAQTSGTTGTPKFIPVTPTDYGRDHRDVMRTWLYHSQCAHRDILDAKVVSLVSPAVEGHAPSGVPFGSTSGHIYQNMPAIIRKTYSIPYPVFEISDYSAKYYVIMRLAVADDVRFLNTANPSSILKMCEKGNEFSEDILRDIRDGTLSPTLELEPEIRKEVEAMLRPNPERARELERARSARDGRLAPADYWPRLSLIACWKGGTVGHYLAKFDDWFNPDGRRPIPVRDWGYLASEMRGSIPLSDEGSAGPLTVATNLFEFVSVDQFDANPDDPAAWTFLTVDQIQDQGEYYVFVTTSGGLYRYDINDVVQVQGYYNKTPQVVFLRKGRGMTNLTGEKISVNQVIQTFETVSRESGLTIAHFRVEADQDRERYLFRIEPIAAPAREQARQVLRALDARLQEINLEYKAKRASQRLKDPVLHVMREGWYERERRRQTSAGRRAFQAKTVVLTPIKAPTQEIRPEIGDIVEFND